MKFVNFMELSYNFVFFNLKINEFYIIYDNRHPCSPIL